ncbi:uncharacterized protein LOC129337136 isoform X2 [Eublepharis macularius]|uniref:Uncharacterized protein LOC129337136 isoform X2 n=1 Tax=Eublepharis macularius TaxID=481883 RepID=A0AA97K0Z8_EUBMA|nr:uncharacterized protein LOC129337136 isoform X2 [Eublepharis macularius]
MEASLTCAVCLSLFEDPVTLPRCSHNFCRTCVAACLGQEQPGPAEAERDSAPGDLSVACPLCRKVCVLAGRNGVAALPVNTTLAEVVKLFKGGGDAWAPGEAAVPQLTPRDAPCGKHPGRPLQLFCRVCCRPACGQCVTEEHRGVFHSVNLIGSLYQEEKLSFFNCLKEIRKLHEQLVKEVADCQDNMETQVHNEEEIIKREFEKICKILEVKKKQFLDDLASRKKKREKEYEIWKKARNAYRKTIEKYLNECEKIANECDPQRFLEVACNLNHRMKTQIDLMQFSSHYENLPGYKEMCMDATPIVSSISALHLTPVNIDAFKDVPCLEFGNTEENSEQEKIQNTFNPVAEIDVLHDGKMIYTRLMSISDMPEFGRMSHEEVRYNYYIAHQVHSCNLERQTPASPLNGSCTFPESSCSSIRAPEAPLFAFNAKASNLKLKPQVPQRQRVNETSFSKSRGYIFSTPAVKLNFSSLNNSLNVFNVQGSQKDSQKTALSEKTDPLFTKVQVPQAHAAALSFGPQTSLTVSPHLYQVAMPSAAVLNQHLSGAVTECSAPTVFSSSSGKEPNSPLKNEKSSTFLLGKLESQSGNIYNINSPTSIIVSSSTTTVPLPESSNGRKPSSSTFPTTSENVFSQPNKQHSSHSLPVQNKTQENEMRCESKEHRLENYSGKKLPGNVSFPNSLPYKTSGCVPWEDCGSGKQPAHGKVSLSFFWETNAMPVFSLPGCVKNNRDTQTSSHKTKNPIDKLRKKSNDLKKSTVEKSIPSSNTKQIRILTRSSSFCFMEKVKSESILVPQENVTHNSAANKTSFADDSTEQNNQFENPPRNEKLKEDDALKNETSYKNTEPDGENLSQAYK